MIGVPFNVTAVQSVARGLRFQNKQAHGNELIPLI